MKQLGIFFSKSTKIQWMKSEGYPFWLNSSDVMIGPERVPKTVRTLSGSFSESFSLVNLKSLLLWTHFDQIFLGSHSLFRRLVKATTGIDVYFRQPFVEKLGHLADPKTFALPLQGPMILRANIKPKTLMNTWMFQEISKRSVCGL